MSRVLVLVFLLVSTAAASDCISHAAKPLEETVENCGCGVSAISSRIVGGKAALQDEFPWQAAIRSLARRTQYCSGTLIDKNWVLSAAHCFRFPRAGDIMVTLGSADSYWNPRNPTVQEMLVKEIIKHPDFQRKQQINDIALLRLSSSAQYTVSVRPICLPFRNASSSFIHSKATVTGWGTTSYKGPESRQLLRVELPIIDNENCKEIFSDKRFSDRIHESCLCTYEPGHDACQGDSGGPLVWYDDTVDRNYLIGIVSWGVGCAMENRPGVFTRVTLFLDWIQQVTGVSVDKFAG